MPEFQVKKQPKMYDAVIVGSGAGGGMAAYVLSKAGLKVCLLEAGPMYDPAKNVTQLKNPWESPRRGASTKFRPFGDFDASYGGWELDGEPYTKANGTEWHWFRSRMLGGRTNHWGRISLRFGPKDFKRKSIDGLGEDWPIGYDDIKPFYDRIDKLIGIFGTNEGLENDPDGIFLPPPRPRLHELMIKKAGQKSGVPVIPSRLSILTQKINDDRGQCFYCSQCSRGCQVYADDKKIKQRENQGVWVLDKNVCPAVILECGYLSNTEDRNYISSKANQEKIARQILRSIEDYFSKTVLIQPSGPSVQVLKDTTPKAKTTNNPGKKNDVTPKYFVDGKEVNAAVANSMNTDNIASVNVTKDSSENTVNIVTRKVDASNKKMVLTVPKSPPPLYILNGTEISEEEMKLIDPNNIESISVLKDKSAETIYGEKGKNGVVVITLKKK